MSAWLEDMRTASCLEPEMLRQRTWMFVVSEVGDDFLDVSDVSTIDGTSETEPRHPDE